MFCWLAPSGPQDSVDMRHYEIKTRLPLPTEQQSLKDPQTQRHFLTQKEPEMETKSAWEEVLDKTSLPRYPPTATGRGMNVRLTELSTGSLADPSSCTSQEDPSVTLSDLLSHLP